MNSLPFTETVWRDLRYAARTLRKSPGFALTTIVTLALTIGANTAVFSIVDTLLIRSLPYPEPDRLGMVAVRYESASRGISSDELSQDGRTWELVRDHAKTIDAAPYSDADWTGGVNLVTPAGAMFVKQQRVGAGFFRVLGVPPLVGREFSREEDVPNGPPLAILSYGLWQRVFHGDPAVVGRRVTLKGEPYTVVGVMPAEFRTTGPVDVWTPLRPSTTGEGEGTNYGIVARVRRERTWAEADAEIAAIGAERLKERRVPREWTVTPRLMPLQEGRTADVRQQLVILWSAVGVVLLIACINIAGLLLARGGTRTRELATRMALGSGRRAILSLLLVESVVLALAGAVLGIAIGLVALDLLAGVAREVFNVWEPLALDGRVLALTAITALGCALLFGMAPAWHASRVNLQPALAASGGRGSTASARWPRRLLIVAEVALGVVLLICAGLFVRTFVNLRALQPGFDPEGVVAAVVSLDDVRYRDVARAEQLFEATLARIRQTPGVDAAAVSLGLPYTRLLNLGFRRLDGGGDQRRGTITNLSYITPEFFGALKIPLFGGRAFGTRDRSGSEPVAIVNRSFVTAYFKGDDPLRRRIAVAGAERTIVGIAGDVRVRSAGWGNFGPIGSPPMVYVPVAQTSSDFLRIVHTWFSPAWIVRSARGAQGLEAAIRAAIASVDPQLPVARFESMAQVQSRAMATERFMALLLVTLGGIAALLAAIGIHGLISTSVTERTRELGIRLALGASYAQAVRSVAWIGIGLAAAGVAIGTVLAASAVNVLRSQLWGVKPSDAATFAAVPVALLAVSAVATLLPARRVLRLDPSITLREE